MAHQENKANRSNVPPPPPAHPEFEPLRVPQRLLALAFLAVALWYLFWRLGTFNPDALVFSAMLYVAECWGLASLLLHLFMTWTECASSAPRTAGSISGRVCHHLQ